MSGFLASLSRQMAALDMDEIFSYQTTKEVRMLDRRLGMVCWAIRAVVFVYVIGYVFVLHEGYTATEAGVGQAVSQVNGTSYSISNGEVRTWDVIDTVQPSLENGAALVASRVFVTKEQHMDNCTNPATHCMTNVDCPKKPPLFPGQCSKGGLCMEMQWCPAFSESDRVRTATHEIEGDGKRYGVWVKGTIMFPTLDPSRVFSTIDAEAQRPYAGGQGQGATVVAESTSSTQLGAGGSGGMPAPDYFTVAELLSPSVKP